MPSIVAPGRPRAFIPTSWNGSSTRALTPGEPRAALDVQPIDGRPEGRRVGRLQADLLGRLGGDEQGRAPRIDQEVERPLAVDPDPDQEVVGVGEAIGDLERPADLRVARAWAPPGGSKARAAAVTAIAVAARTAASRHTVESWARFAFRSTVTAHARAGPGRGDRSDSTRPLHYSRSTETRSSRPAAQAAGTLRVPSPPPAGRPAAMARGACLRLRRDPARSNRIGRRIRAGLLDDDRRQAQSGLDLLGGQRRRPSARRYRPARRLIASPAASCRPPMSSLAGTSGGKANLPSVTFSSACSNG